MRSAVARMGAAARCLVTGLLMGAAGVALAASTSTRFEPGVVVQGAPLVLNGAGTRYKAIFKVYDVALYAPRKVGTAAELLALPGPKRLQFTALREVSGTDLGRLFIKGLGENAKREEVNRHLPSMSRFIEVFSGRARLMPGDSFAMDFIPGQGTQFYIAGRPQGAPVGDDEFINLVLKIWLGEVPADHMLKDALLGIEPSR